MTLTRGPQQGGGGRPVLVGVGMLVQAGQPWPWVPRQGGADVWGWACWACCSMGQPRALLTPNPIPRPHRLSRSFSGNWTAFKGSARLRPWLRQS